MPKKLVFQFGDKEISFVMNKVDRAKLYGFKELRALDESDEACELATLAGDGCTLIGRGGTGLGWLDADGAWREKSELTPIDREGKSIEPVPSSFDAAIKLFDDTTVEDYLEHDIRLVYSLETDEGIDELTTELKRGTIFKFPYSYRGGLEADVGFLLTNDGGDVMLVIGDPTRVGFIGMAAPAGPVDESGADADEGGLMDFDMI